MAKSYGRTSKIVRYYWREIAFETIPRFAKWAEEQGFSDWTEALVTHEDTYKSIEKEVREEIKLLHNQSPKYNYQEESQSEIIQKYRIEVVDVYATYTKNSSRGFQIFKNGVDISPEEFVTKYFEDLGYLTIATESVPFHILFGVFMWLLIQDFDDPELNFVIFGDRFEFDNGERGTFIKTYLPIDFGTSTYSQRRKLAIEEHFKLIPDNEEDKNELLWLFDFWLEPSAELRQYLWAHRPHDIEKARQILSILPVFQVKKILFYLIENYWKRYLGWSDLLVYNDTEYFFAEVKSSKDQLSEDQKVWIDGNSEYLQLPFKLVKIHKKSVL